MVRPKNVKKEEPSIVKEMNAEIEKKAISIEDMPLESLRDYRKYNEEARKINKKLRVLRHPIKQCPIELHPSQRVIFKRNDQPTNKLPVLLSNHLIHFEKTLHPGKTYDLPECVISYLASKGYPVWDWITNPDGSTETKVINTVPRFSLNTVFEK